jgi:hypothetical protein
MAWKEDARLSSYNFDISDNVDILLKGTNRHNNIALCCAFVRLSAVSTGIIKFRGRASSKAEIFNALATRLKQPIRPQRQTDIRFTRANFGAKEILILFYDGRVVWIRLNYWDDYLLSLLLVSCGRIKPCGHLVRETRRRGFNLPQHNEFIALIHTMAESTKKRTLGAFFKPPPKKARVSETGDQRESGESFEDHVSSTSLNCSIAETD